MKATVSVKYNFFPYLYIGVRARDELQVEINE